MKISFNTPARKRLIMLAAAVLAVMYIAFTGRAVVASWLGSRPGLISLTWAVRVDPGNADYRNQLGRYYDLVARDPQTAIRHFKDAVQLNPHSAHLWFDLASAYQVIGDTPRQTDALEHAIQVDPMTPDVAWEAANLYLVQGENEKALREFRVVLANDPSLAGNAAQFCWHINPDIDSLLRDAIPHTAEAHLAFLNLLQAKQETDASYKVWNALIQTGETFDKPTAYAYFQYLILHKAVEQAVRVWQQTTEHFGLTSYLPSSSNLMVNGDFSFNLLNAGFDWQYQRQSDVELRLDASDFHTGSRSFAINFAGAGITDAGIYEYVPLQPSTTYHFSAYYKTGAIDGAGGPHFTVQDMYSQAIYFESDELRDAATWKLVDGEFKTPADCQLVVVHIRRLPLGSPIRGKLWVDDFRITRKPT